MRAYMHACGHTTHGCDVMTLLIVAVTSVAVAQGSVASGLACKLFGVLYVNYYVGTDGRFSRSTCVKKRRQIATGKCIAEQEFTLRRERTCVANTVADLSTCEMRNVLVRSSEMLLRKVLRRYIFSRMYKKP